MKMAAKNVVMSAMLISIGMASACGGSTGQPASTHGSSGTNATASGTNATASGTNATASGTNATASTSQSKDKVSGSPSSGSSKTTAPPTSNNQVLLDPDTAIHGYPYSFGRTLPRLARTSQFEVTSRYKQPVTVHITTDSPYFVPTGNCNLELQPGGSCIFSITFSAPRNGSYRASLLITIGGSGTVSRELTGIVGVAVNSPPTQTAPGGNTPTQSASNATPSGSAASG
jgi:hypothetical protein